MKVKLFDLARELEVGVATLNDFLVAKKIIETPSNNPNARIDAKEYRLIMGEFGSTLSVARREEIERKLFPQPKSTKVKTEVKMGDAKKNETPRETSTTKPDEVPSFQVKGHIDLKTLSSPKKEREDNSKKKLVEVTPPQPKKQEDPQEKETPIKLEEKEKTTDKDLSQKLTVEEGSSSMQKVSVAEPIKKDVASPKEDLSIGENKLLSEDKKEKKEDLIVEKVVLHPVNESKNIEKKNTPSMSQNQDKKKENTQIIKATQRTETAPKSTILKQKETTSEPSHTEKKKGNKQVLEKESDATTPKKEEEIFRFEVKEPRGFNIKGKIDLTALEPSSKAKKDKKSRRKRISTSAVDIKAEAAKGVNASKNKEARREDRNGNKNNRGNNSHRQEGSGEHRQDANAQQQASQNLGRKAKRNAKRNHSEEKHEVSSEDIERQVKEVRARIAAGKKQSFGKTDTRRRRDMAKRQAERDALAQQDEVKVIKITEFVTVSDLANLMGVPVNEVIATCMSIDMMVSINMRLDSDTITLIAEEFGFQTEFVSADVVEAIAENKEEDKEEDLVSRPPVVTVMGHVDHGKTSLLDHIRNTNVIAGEAGGITQHIGAYSVKLKNGRRITFLDTPGHQAFTAMRARGAKATDIAIIIIDATSNVMPQTKEALNHASAAGVPIVFAINKVDKPTANPNHIKEQLAQLNYLVEDWGGKYQCQEISAKKGDGVRELIDKVLLEADILDLKANPNKVASGSIIESSLDKGRGYVSQILVSNGTLRIGDMVLAGKYCGRVRALTNERGQSMTEADPSTPATLLGLDGAPTAGDTFNVLENEQEARNIARRRRQLDREQDIRTQHRLTLEQIGQRIKIGNFKELNLIIKGDVDGSIEALSDSFIKLSTAEIEVKVIHKAVGQISENDVDLAKASDAIIIGFQVRPNATARKLAEQYGVEIRTYSIIYDAIDDVKSAMEGMLSPEIREQVTASLEVLQVFNIKGAGAIAGCMVKEGKIKRSDKVRVIREGIVVHTGALASLKRYKDDAKEVVSGLECGLSITNYDDIQVGDTLESFMEIEMKKTL